MAYGAQAFRGRQAPGIVSADKISPGRQPRVGLRLGDLSERYAISELPRAAEVFPNEQSRNGTARCAKLLSKAR